MLGVITVDFYTCNLIYVYISSNSLNGETSIVFITMSLYYNIAFYFKVLDNKSFKPYYNIRSIKYITSN